MPLVWGANMAIRRRALERVGRIRRGDARDAATRRTGSAATRQAGGRIRYVAAAGLDHRRTRRRLHRCAGCSRAAYGHGRAGRRYDVRKGEAPSLAAELRTLLGCVWHIFRRRCANGIVMTAQAAGRLRESVAGATMSRPFRPTTSCRAPAARCGASAPPRGHWSADAVCDAAALARLEPWRLARAARATPRRRVLALGIEREGVPNLLPAARRELSAQPPSGAVRVGTWPAIAASSRTWTLLLERHPAAGHDWLLVIDDDVALPAGFLDAFLFLAERFGLRLAQPAHRWRSHAAVPVTRRRPGSVVRETAFVEIGPVTALHAVTFGELLPFPPLQAGWGLDAHWSAVAAPAALDDSASSTPLRSGTACAGRRRPTTGRQPSSRRASFSPSVPT